MFTDDGVHYALHLNFCQNTQTWPIPWSALTTWQSRGRRSSHPKQLQLFPPRHLPSRYAGRQCCQPLTFNKGSFLALKALLPPSVPGESHTEPSHLTLPWDRVATIIQPSSEFSSEVRSGFIIS